MACRRATLAELDSTIEMCRDNPGLTLCLAVNYGARAEIVQAAAATCP